MRVFKADPRECERATLRLLGGGDGGGGSFEGTPADCLLVQQCGCNIATAQLQWHPFILLTIRVRARAYALCTWRYVIQMQSASGHINNAFINFTLTHGRASERTSYLNIRRPVCLAVRVPAFPLAGVRQQNRHLHQRDTHTCAHSVHDLCELFNFCPSEQQC